MTTYPDHLESDDRDDYVAECGEHIGTARTILLDLEVGADPLAITASQLDELFRNFHTIKGLSGMVGVRAAEDVAHRLESYLGTVRTDRSALTAAGLDALLAGLGVIESAVVAFRDRGPEPDVAPFVERLSGLASGTSVRAAEVPGDRAAKLEAALARGDRVWAVTFPPAPELAARGVTVNVVRGRLRDAGEILHAEPVPVPGGGVRFSFLFAARADANFTGWPADNVAAEPYRPPTEAALPALPAVPLASANLVRVDLGRLDDLMRTVGELVLSRARLENGLARVAKYLPPRDRRDLEETTQGLDRQLRDLREGVMRVRLVPVRELFNRMRLVVRDLTRETGKDVELVISGEDTEIDKFVVERMADPLLHLVRNAVSHGLESPAERAAAGKPPRGKLALRAAAAGGTIVLEVEDDGRGVRVEAVYARARSLGLVAADAPADAAGVLDLICSPGFSTRAEADRASGRGVGMDVARRAVEQGLGGSLSLDTRPGQGTRFTARLPLTLVVADVLTVTVGDQTYAVPRTAVREVVPVEAGSTTLFENNELVRHHGGVLPLVRLCDVFHHPRPAGPCVALVVGEGAAAMALAADRAIGLREVVVRPLSDPLVQVPGVGGATELGDGRPILILDPVGLARYNRRRSAASPVRAGGPS